eukprot:13352800-Heterocapsa_arctica.AAC.1
MALDTVSSLGLQEPRLRVGARSLGSVALIAVWALPSSANQISLHQFAEGERRQGPLSAAVPKRIVWMVVPPMAPEER